MLASAILKSLPSTSYRLVILTSSHADYIPSLSDTDELALSVHRFNEKPNNLSMQLAS